MKDYKKILEGVVNIINTSEKSDIGFDNIRAYIGKNCPELKESEDERIRKELLEHCKNQAKPYIQTGNKCPQIQSWITWLEKQKKVEKVDNADNVEPKFKVGDFIINDYCMGKVIELTNDAYQLDSGQGIPFSCEHNAHLWTIDDAKDGDVLFEDKISSLPSPFIVIFKKKDSVNTFSSHCFIGFDGKFYEGESEHYSENLYPATKEQQYHLFKAMADAGYTFDFDKKELKKIEQKPDDKKGMNLVEEEMTPFQKKVFCIIDTTIEEEQGLKQVCDELFALASNEIKQKPALNEEDEKMIESIITDIKYCKKAYNNYSFHENEIDWLKSLKDRYTWKPGDEQMKAFEFFIRSWGESGAVIAQDSTYNQMRSLYEDLKNLK